MPENRNETAINKVPTNPDYLAQYIEQDDSLEMLKEHRTVPRFKIVQATTEQELQGSFGVGSCVVRPGDALVAKFNAEPKTFDFVPLFFVCEYAKWRDLKGTGPMILERSADPGSDLARRAKSAELRKEAYPNQNHIADEKDKMYYSYVEHLRFIGVIYGDHPLAGTPVTLSFERGEWRQGKNFISAITMRREEVNGESKPVPLWAQVWRFKIIHHAPDQKRKWYGFAFEPADPSLINQEDAPAMQALHKEFKELAQKQLLVVQDEADAPPEDEASVPASSEF